MILPQTFFGALLLLLLTLFCWGSWANTFKLAGKWRFELYYFDFAFGVLLAAVVCAFTLGSQPTADGLEFLDDIAHTGRRQAVYGFAAGAIFNLANMLFMAAISVAGLAVAFPVGLGTALFVGTLVNYAVQPKGNTVLLFSGVAIVAASIVADALAYRSHARAKLEEEIGKAGRTKSKKKKDGSLKAIILCVASGVLMGSYFPLIDLAKAGDNGMGPYSVGLVFAAGVFASTFLLNLFLMNLPVQGQAVEILDYFKGRATQHLLGLLGGALWFSGMISSLVVAAAVAKDAQIGPAAGLALRQGATMIGALWGLLVWKEFQNADVRVKTLIILTLVLFVSGLGMISIAPLYSR